MAVVTATEMDALDEDDKRSTDRRRRPSHSPLLSPTRSPKSKYARAWSDELITEAEEVQESQTPTSPEWQESQTPTSPEPLLPTGDLVLPAPLIRVSTDERGRRCHPCSVFHHMCCSCRTMIRLCCGCTWCTWCWCALLAPALPLLMSKSSEQPHAWDFLWMDLNATHVVPPAPPPGDGWG